MKRLRGEISAAQDQPPHALLDDVPAILDGLANALDGESQRSIGRERFIAHAEQRIGWTNYRVDELVREYAILRRTIFSVLEQERPLSSAERDVILEYIDQAIQVSTAHFSEIRGFNERLEKQYLKLIEHLVVESGETGATGGLERLLEIVVWELGAEVASFLLYHEDTLELTFSAAAGKTDHLAGVYRAALAVSRANSSANKTGPAVRIIEVARLDPGAQEALRDPGVGCLVSVDILSRGRVPGVLCLGFRERRVFDPVEIHLLETLGDRLALLLASIQLRDESRSAVEQARRETVMVEAERNALDEERRRRDELIAAISHDLKNPLTAAKAGAELLRKGSSSPSTTERVADQILRSIGRSDQMIHNLLDAHRIRAGKRLPLTIERYDMKDLVDEVVKGLSLVHGDRFVVDAEPDVTGFWSWDAMRRALENLLNNAVKYGDPKAPVTIRLRATEDRKMSLSVHNQGVPLAGEDQARIFLPFERGKSAERTGARGWGIGLTLVKGIVDAHGGTVTVESTREDGTTFTIRNPMDSRSYQEDDEHG